MADFFSPIRRGNQIVQVFLRVRFLLYPFFPRDHCFSLLDLYFTHSPLLCPWDLILAVLAKSTFWTIWETPLVLWLGRWFLWLLSLYQQECQSWWPFRVRGRSWSCTWQCFCLSFFLVHSQQGEITAYSGCSLGDQDLLELSAQVGNPVFCCQKSPKRAGRRQG